MKAMTRLTIAHRSAYYAGICALLILAMSTSHAAKPSAFAEDDNRSTSGGDGETVVHIDVLANDTDPDGLIADLIVTTPPEFGTAVRQGPDLDIDDPGSLNVIHVDYNIAPGFGGTETFTYEIVDKNGKTLDSATVTITVDGSTSVIKPGAHKVVFGGAAFPDSEVPLSAAGELANTGGTSTVQCCKVPDPRVSKKKGIIAFDWTPFDLGAAMGSLCAEMFSDLGIAPPAPGQLIVPPHFSVHTDPDISDQDLTKDDFKFGACVVNTGVEWVGPMQVDVVAEPVVDYEVNCEPGPVHKQPLVLGLSEDEFTSPEMRAITIECDPRGVTRWSKAFFVVNGMHRADKDASNGYVARMFTTLRSMIEEMRKQNAVDSTFLKDLTGIVLAAQNPSNSASASMAHLDNATLMALTPGDPDPYFPSPTAKFSNPKGELVSHLMALRYAICSELAHPGNVKHDECRVPEDSPVGAALPKLP
jgi:hypothetical protein